MEKQTWKLVFVGCGKFEDLGFRIYMFRVYGVKSRVWGLAVAGPRVRGQGQLFRD